MKQIIIEHCGNCPFYSQSYCTLSAAIGTVMTLYAKNEWRNDEIHRDCPLLKDAEIVIKMKSKEGEK